MEPGTVRAAHLGLKEHLLRGFAYCVVHLVHRPRLYGTLPKLDEPTIFVCRHVGLMDPVVLMVEYARYMLHPLVANDYYNKNGFTRFFYKMAFCIPIERHKASRQWIEDSMAVLGKGEHVIIFPEGTRNKNADKSELGEFREGSLKIAQRTGCPVVPVAISGTADIYENHRPFVRRAHVTVRFLEPFRIAELEGEHRKKPAAYTRGLIMDQLKKSSENR